MKRKNKLIWLGASVVFSAFLPLSIVSCSNSATKTPDISNQELLEAEANKFVSTVGITNDPMQTAFHAIDTIKGTTSQKLEAIQALSSDLQIPTTSNNNFSYEMMIMSINDSERVMVEIIISLGNESTTVNIIINGFHKRYLGNVFSKEAVKFLGWENKATITFEDWEKYAPLVTIIGNGHASLGLNKIETMEIPGKIEEIMNSSFQYFSTLKNVAFSNNSKLRLIHSGAFWGTAIENFTIPDSVERIGSRALYSCSNLTTVITTPRSILENIDPGTFSNNSKLNHITLPNSIKNVGLQNDYFGLTTEQWDNINWI